MDKRKKLQKAALREMQEEVRFRRHKYVAPVGIVFLLLAAVGLVTVCVFCVRFTQRLLDNSAEKARFEQVITPVLMLDPVPFGSAADADPLFLLQSSLWSALLGDKRESYQANEDSLGRIPVWMSRLRGFMETSSWSTSRLRLTMSTTMSMMRIPRRIMSR